MDGGLNMKCTICGKEYDDEEFDNINEICPECQCGLEQIYEEQEYENPAERLEVLIEFLKKERGDSNGRAQ